MSDLLKFDAFNRAFDAFERRILVRHIADLVAGRREIARYPHEIDIEIVRHLENTRANLVKVLKHLDERLKDTDGQMSFSEMMIEACGSGEPLTHQTKPRSLPPASSKKPT